mmetsp:Transcript_3046/g.6827  ORF Transcript_3046/g.6827 Transcript_3046/m.6827 type:complete len:246 (+) Transcript_3046:107-844(+)
MHGLTCEVVLTKDGALMQALCFVKLDANPFTGGKFHIATEHHCALQVTPGDLLADAEGAAGRCHRRWHWCRGRCDRCWCSDRCCNCRRGSWHCSTGNAQLIGLGEDTHLLRACEVGDVKECTIVHALRRIQLHAHPLAISKLHLAHVLHCALGAFPINPLPNCHGSSCGCGCRGHGCLCWCSGGNGGRRCRSEICQGTENSMLRLALEVRDSENSAIMNPLGFVKLDANPVAGSEAHEAKVLHGS